MKTLCYTNKRKGPPPLRKQAKFYIEEYTKCVIKPPKKTTTQIAPRGRSIEYGISSRLRISFTNLYAAVFPVLGSPLITITSAIILKF